MVQTSSSTRLSGAKNLPSRSSNATFSDGLLRLRDGSELYFCIEGEGPPMVFCYGLVCSSLHWTYQIEALRSHYQCIWFDYRGHHRSSKPKQLRSLNIPQFAEDLSELIRHLKLPPVILLGHSMGVNVALELTLQRPDFVRKLILANGTPARPLDYLMQSNLSSRLFDQLRRIQKTTPGLIKFAWDRGSKLRFLELAVLIGGFNPNLTHPRDVETYLEQVRSLGPTIFFEVLEHYRNHDVTSWLHTIETPTLVIAGEDDHITPAHLQRQMHQLMPDSKFELIFRGSHCCQMDYPDVINKMIQDFAETT